MTATLPRRAFLGARLPPDDDAFTADGVAVAAVVAGGMAAEAGVIAGDRLVALSGAPLTTPARLAAALRGAGAGRDAEVAYRRSDAVHRRVVPVRPWPREALPGQQVEHGVLAVPGARLRTIVTVPDDGEPPAAAVLLIQGLACASIEADGDGGPALAALAAGWAGAGLMTMRLDRRGVGDSDGGACGDVDFTTEVADHRAALAALAADPRAAGAPLLVFGHSVGGMIAALLAAERDLDGVIVAGTSAVPWLACVEASARRQLALRGVAAAEADARAAAVRARALSDGLHGRSATYHRQLDAIALPSAWAATRARRLLVLRGEHDWVIGDDDVDALVAVVPAGVPVARHVVAGVDHLLGRHADRAASLRDYGSGRFDPAIVGTTLAWLVGSPP
ncbi:MAG: alpha/beta fold hydrolase [Kofleriaceae bacterium]|nr:alpha/beta fold hydrolase [Kofleriaceae bacterium]